MDHSRNPAPTSFHRTRWSLVTNAQSHDPVVRRAALDELVRAYWTPLYAFLRRRGMDEHRSMDLTQEFLLRLLGGAGVDGANAGKGRFRSYLLGALEHFVSNHDRAAAAIKRGGRAQTLSLDALAAERQYASEIVSTETPERAFDRQFALAALDRSLARVRDEYAARGREAVFDRLAAFLGIAPGPGDYAQAASDLDSNETSIKVTVHRMRSRLREHLLEEVAQTLHDPGETGAELAALFAALRNPKSRV